MKNLFIYIRNPERLSGESLELLKVQVDNSLRLGWKKEDLMMVTDYEYDFKGIKSIVVSPDNFCHFSPPASKVNAILELFERNLIGDDLYWFHDLDCYQLAPLEIEMTAPLAACDYGGMDRWTTGTMFFNKHARVIFQRMREIVYKYQTDEERALMTLTGHDVRLTSIHSLTNFISAQSKYNVQKLNITYNINYIYLEKCLKLAEKPWRVMHFHPIRRNKKGPPFLEMFDPYIPQELKELFKTYGLTEVYTSPKKGLDHPSGSAS